MERWKGRKVERRKAEDFGGSSLCVWRGGGGVARGLPSPWEADIRKLLPPRSRMSRRLSRSSRRGVAAAARSFRKCDYNATALLNRSPLWRKTLEGGLMSIRFPGGGGHAGKGKPSPRTPLPGALRAK